MSSIQAPNLSHDDMICVYVNATGEAITPAPEYDGTTLTVSGVPRAKLTAAYILILWRTVRATRDSRINKCDWTQVADSPLTVTQKTAWQTYRQALRDITKQTDPANITWPTPPA